jgi:hypothetical protein
VSAERQIKGDDAVYRLFWLKLRSDPALAAEHAAMLEAACNVIALDMGDDDR